MIVKIEDLTDVRNLNHNKKIVLTSGTYDLFHVGHLNYLKKVKSFGDILVVILSGDKRVRGRKGKGRPIIPETDRAQILDALKVVDYVFIDPANYRPDQIDPIHTVILERLKPDLYVTDGEDIRFSKIMEASKLVIMPRAVGHNHTSTTAIIEHIAKLKQRKTK
jgi:rfaE bifunctional protein nucleotidyltransferase chain/domain